MSLSSGQPGFVSDRSFADCEALAARFAGAKPFPHLVIDDFLTPDFAARVHDEARATLANQDASNDITQSRKTACTDWGAFGDDVFRLIAYLNSGAFIGPLERITGISGLFGDPSLEGGGIHMTRRGGFLKMHTDFNWHAGLKADRRINILYYLNRDWQPDLGGELAIASLGQSDTQMIAPLFNRLVIFNTNDHTLHGHPDPLLFPEDYPRASIALYYYSVGKPLSERRRLRATTTRYLPRHADDIDLRAGGWRSRLGYLVRRFTPF